MKHDARDKVRRFSSFLNRVPGSALESNTEDAIGTALMGIEVLHADTEFEVGALLYALLAS